MNSQRKNLRGAPNCGATFIHGRFGRVIAAVAASVFATVASAANITVNCGSVIRGVTRCGSGSLYGVLETQPADIAGLVQPLRPRVFVNPARAGSQYQQDRGAGLPVAQRLSGVVPSAKVMLRLADICPGWPYQFPGMSSWLNQVTSVINDKKSSGLTNIYGYEIWNEPKGTWNTANGDFNSVLWKQTYAKIRALDPGALIVGPSYAVYNATDIRNFLSFCKSNACLPDVICWHELSTHVASVASHLKDYRLAESSLGISARKISINEYCAPDHNLEGQPASCACFIAKFERYKVDNASISFWWTEGRLGSLLATDTQKGAGWYFFKWYGDMWGNMVSVIPPVEDSSTVDGFCSVDSNAGYVTLLMGGDNSGTINVTFNSVPSFIGANAKITVEAVNWTSRTSVSSGPVTITTQTKAVSSGQVTISITGCNNSSGYRVRLSPG